MMAFVLAMISLASEMTDVKGRRARAGWVFFDAQCAFCTRWARRMSGVLEARGFGLAPLQSPRVRALLHLPEDKLLREVRLLTSDGVVRGGADALLFLARRIWWAWPFYALAQVPGARAFLEACYRALAARHHRLAGECACG